jgi:hypothetical protein
MFPDVGPRGGTLLNIPLLTSRTSPTDTAGGQIALVDAGGIAYGEGGIEVDSSEEAMVQMQSVPLTDSTAAWVSLWQMNRVGVRMVMEANWRTARSGSVVILSGVNYA